MAKPQDLNKATKAKKEKSGKAPAAGLSEDRVVDSDSESEQKKVPKPVQAAERPKKTKSKTSSTTKNAAIPPPPPAPVKKAESSDDDDSDEESDSDSDSDSGSGSDDLDGDGDDESTASEGKSDDLAGPTKVNGVKRKVGDSSSSEEGESDSGESLAEVNSQPTAKRAKTQQKPATPAESEQVAPLSAIPAPSSFVAPKDFHPIDIVNLHSTFPTNISGKQLWHITAPSSLSIAEIETVALDAIADGSTVLTHKGSHYRLAEDTTTSSKTFSVFLPGKEGYRRSEMQVEKTLHLQQKIKLPNLSSKQARTETGGEIAADVWKPVEEGVRPQPKGMRMRYKPPGFGLGEPGLGSDDEEEGFKLPKSQKAKKARRESGDAMEGVESTGKVLSKEERKKAKKTKGKAAKDL